MNRLIRLALGALLMGTLPAVTHADDKSAATSPSAPGVQAPAVPPVGPGDHMGPPPISPAEMINKRVEHLTKQLSLTPDQQQKVRAVLQDEATQMEPLHQQMKTLHDQSDGKVNALLTADQQKKFMEMKEHRAEQMEKMERKMKK